MDALTRPRAILSSRTGRGYAVTESMTDGFDPRTVERRIREYESFGIHRTGWGGDDRAAAWVRDELRDGGVDASLEQFVFPRVELRSARLTWPGGSADGIPLHDGGFTRLGGIEGKLVEPTSDDLLGNIVVAPVNDAEFAQPTIYRRIEELEEAGVIALVLPRGGPDGEITALNATRIDQPFTVPVLQIAANDARELAPAILLGVEGTVEIDGERLQSRASNTVATIPGTDADAAAVGIMTPRSGWFSCASERGGGIAILLALAQWIAAQEQSRTVHLLASSGHELHHYGLRAYLAARPGIESAPLAWLHLGANIGSSTGPVAAESNDEGFTSRTDACLGAEAPGRYLMIDQRGGEAVNIDRAGGRYVSFRGRNDFFHSPHDLFDRACDATLVAAAGRAARSLVEGWLAP